MRLNVILIEYIKKYRKIYILSILYTFCIRRGYMPLTRKARIVGSSLVITIPSQLAKAHDINNGDNIEIIPLGLGEFRIRKIMLK